MPEDAAIPFDHDNPVTAPVAAPQRARGKAHLSVVPRGVASVLSDLQMSGSAKLLFPRPNGAALDAVLLNSSGGITGGDTLDVSAQVGQGAVLRMTTQAAERIYRAPPGLPGRVRTHLTLDAGARMLWLPQETILFDGAALDRSLRVDIGAGAHFLGCEALVFGRAAMGETVMDLRLSDRIDLNINGDLAFADRLRLDGNADQTLSRAMVANGAGAMASVILAGPDAATRLDAIRALLPTHAGASALREDLVFARILAADSFDLRASLVPLLQTMAQDDLPRPWML